jgi:hypothetical protein
LDWAEYKALWQEIDRRFGAGEYTAEEAVEAARQHRLIAPSTSPNLPHEVRDVMAFAPDSYLAFRPWLLVVFADQRTPLVYRPATEPLLRRH